MLTGGESSVSKKSSVRFLVALLFVTFTTAALVVADFAVLAQNANSSTTQDNTGMQNANMGRRSRRGRRGRRGRRRAAAANANMAGEANANAAEATGQNTNTGMENMNTGGMTTGTRGRRGRRGRRRAAGAAAAASTGMEANANVSGGEQTDLSGTYTGTINCLGMSGDSTLTVNGNQFTLSGASTGSGRITAVTTRGYTGATLRFDAAGGGTPQSVSVRAKKSGDRLWLTPVPGEMNKCSFTPGGGSAGGARHGRRVRRGRRGAAAPAATTTDMTTTTPATGEETSTPATTTTPRTRGRRRGRRGGAANSNSNMGGNANSNSTPPQL